MGLFRRRPRSAPAEAVIDLRQRLAHVDEQLDAASGPWGRPTRCPVCAAPGYLDRLDLVDSVMYQHCPECGERWTTRDPEAARTSRS